MRSRFSRLSLLTKILLSTSVAITVLFAITGRDRAAQHHQDACRTAWRTRCRAAFTPTRRCGNRAPNCCNA